jgi:hypothetical protein
MEGAGIIQAINEIIYIFGVVNQGQPSGNFEKAI